MSTSGESSIDSPMCNSKFASQEMDRRFCKARNSYRKQPYDTSPTSIGTPCSSDESQPDLEDTLSNEERVPSGEQKKYRRVQANNRERKRMHTVNAAFDDLRDLVPTYPSNRKLSKIETLRLACAYIEDLAQLLRDTTVVRGQDVNLQYCEGFMPPAAIPSYSSVKSEFTPPEYNSCSFQHYRVPLSYVSLNYYFNNSTFKNLL